MTLACCGTCDLVQPPRRTSAKIDRPNFRCPDIQKVECIKLTHIEKVGTFYETLVSSVAGLYSFELWPESGQHFGKAVLKREIGLAFVYQLHYH